MTASVTFQADMTTLLSQGWDGNTHFMEIRGGLNGWAAGDVLAEDLTDPASIFNNKRDYCDAWFCPRMEIQSKS